MIWSIFRVHIFTINSCEFFCVWEFGSLKEQLVAVELKSWKLDYFNVFLCDEKFWNILSRYNWNNLSIVFSLSYKPEKLSIINCHIFYKVKNTKAYLAQNRDEKFRASQKQRKPRWNHPITFQQMRSQLPRKSHSRLHHRQKKNQKRNRPRGNAKRAMKSLR